MLELGKGFMYVDKQYRIPLGGGISQRVDLVFYNKLLKAYVLIDIKKGRFRHENVGQMNAYLNYFEAEINADNDAKQWE